MRRSRFCSPSGDGFIPCLDHVNDEARSRSKWGQEHCAFGAWSRSHRPKLARWGQKVAARNVRDGDLGWPHSLRLQGDHGQGRMIRDSLVFEMKMVGTLLTSRIPTRTQELRWRLYLSAPSFGGTMWTPSPRAEGAVLLSSPRRGEEICDRSRRSAGGPCPESDA